MESSLILCEGGRFSGGFGGLGGFFGDVNRVDRVNLLFHLIGLKFNLNFSINFVY